VGELTDFIASLAEPTRSLVDRYRTRALALVPQAEEGTSYGMPALRYRGRPLIAIRITKSGYSAYPFSSDVVADVCARFPGLDATKGGIRFTDRKPLPDEVYDALVEGRRQEIDAALARRR
jgi:uncharacterized protein YdhG (YjbR/CyaY superfamily)